jgi:hypothetical protein
VSGGERGTTRANDQRDPTSAVRSAGTLIGPGQWITVKKTQGFSNPVTLYNGKTVNLESYGLGWSGDVLLRSS